MFTITRVQKSRFKSVITPMAVALALVLSMFDQPSLAQQADDAVQLGLDGGGQGLSLADRQNPNVVVRSYYTFISAGQFNDALALLGPSFGIETVRSIASEMRKLSRRVRDGEVSISLDQVYQQGDWALAVLLIEVLNDDGTSSKVVADQYLMQSGGVWTVVPKQLREDESFLTFFNQNARVLNQWWQNNRVSITAKLTQG